MISDNCSYIYIELESATTPKSMEVQQDKKQNDDNDGNDELNDLQERGQKIVATKRNVLIYFDYIPRPVFQEFLQTLPMDLQIPRSEWKTHNKWKSQTLLVKGHKNFRLKSQEFVKIILELVRNWNCAVVYPSLILKRLHHQLLYFSRLLSGHSKYEDQKLFPYLIKKYDQTDSKMIQLLIGDESYENGHYTLKKIESQIYKQLEILINNKDKCNLKQCKYLLLLLVHFDNKLIQHLGEEESLVLPMLWCLTNEQYQTYYNSPSPCIQNCACVPKKKGKKK